jgi:hypothetical protein
VARLIWVSYLIINDAPRNRVEEFAQILKFDCETTPVRENTDPRLRDKAPLAQLAEQLTLNQRVAGSIPARCIFPFSS